MIGCLFTSRYREGAFQMGDSFPAFRRTGEGLSVLLAQAVASVTFIYMWGCLVAQSVQHPTSAQGTRSMVPEFELHISLSAVGTEPASDSPSPCPSATSSLSLSFSVKNKYLIKSNKINQYAIVAHLGEACPWHPQYINFLVHGSSCFFFFLMFIYF